MAVIVNLQIQCQQGKGPDFLAMAKEILPDTRAYDGCSEANLCTNIEEGEDKVEVISKWESKAHYDKYLQWRVDTGLLEALAPYLEGEPVFRFLEVDTTY